MNREFLSVALTVEHAPYHRPLVGTGSFQYEWVEDWATIPATPAGRSDGRTHGVACSERGYVIVFHQANPAVLIFDAEGRLVDCWGDRFPGAHGLTLVKEGGTEFLWLADSSTGEVVKTTLEGETVMSLERPDLPNYRGGANYKPTWVAVHEEAHGGNGDIWVTDGYGANHIHWYNRKGQYIGSINGEEGAAGAFKCPHGISIDYRGGEGELYIADRGNHRVQVYDMAGNFRRSFGEDSLTSPCAFVTSGDLLIVPELRARVAVLDDDDHVVGYLGENEAICNIAGWPNHPAQLIQPGRFNSPHGIASDAQGNLYVVEWIIGGRITKLARCG